VAALEAHRDAVNAVALMPSAPSFHGDIAGPPGIVSGSADGSVVVWESLGQNDACGGVEGERGGGRGQSWRIRHVLRADGGRVGAVAASVDGRLVATGHTDGRVRVWDAESGELTATLDKSEGEIKCVGFWGVPVVDGGGTLRRDGVRGSCWLAAGSTDRRLALWRMQSLRGAAASSAGAAACGHAAGSWVRAHSLTGHSGSIVALAFPPPHGERGGAAALGPPGLMVASGSYDRTIRVWECGEAGAAEVLCLRGHNHWVMSVCYSCCGTRLCSGSYDRSVRIWDAVSGQPLHTLGKSRGREP
jgi:WD40 repeat protein